MFDEEDKELRSLFQGMERTPFRDELKIKILEQARSEGVAVTRTRRSRGIWRRNVSIATGLVAACAVVVGAITYGTNSSRDKTTATTNQVSFEASASAFGLANAPVKVSNVRIGNVAKDPVNSDVLADVTNTSNQPITEADMFGVLSFTPNNSKSTQENWLTFVNGPSEVVQPGQTVLWSFHPEGESLHASATSQQIVEVPHLKFYSSKLVQTSQANAVWKRSTLQVSNVQAQPRPNYHDGTESAQLNVTLHNGTKKPVDLANERAVIWFSDSPNQSFLSENSVRFLYHMVSTGIPSWPTVVQPGQTIHVSFLVLSSAKTDFFSRTPHVIVIDEPNVTS